MTRAQLYERLRELLDESGQDAGWSPTTLFGYLAEAQEQFCEDSGYFVDKRTFTVQVRAGETAYELDERIIEVFDVFGADGRRLGQVSQTSKNWGETDSDYLIPESSHPVTPYEYQTDEETGILTLVQTPVEDEVLRLRVHRYPLYSLDNEDVEGDDGMGTAAQPEIPVRFHMGLVYYAAAQALMHHDMEQQDPVKAKDHMAEYYRYARRGKRARIRREGVRRNVAPSPAYVVRP